MDELEKNYFKTLCDDLSGGNISLKRNDFYFPLMPLQYSYVHNLRTGRLENVQGVDRVLGYSNEDFTLELYYEKLHPIDRRMIFETSRDTLDLANARIRQGIAEGPFESQFTILYRIKSNENKYVQILRQSTILEHGEKIYKTFSLCTDVSALGLTYKVNSAFRFGSLEKTYSIKQIKELMHREWGNLTPREIEILELISRGKTTKEIGERLHISIYTVNKHRQNIINKTSIRDLQELINRTFRGSL